MLLIDIDRILIMKKLLMLSVMALTLAGCDYHDRRLQDGAMLGGAGGAIIGGVATNTVGGALVGGVVGATAGVLIADATRHHHHRRGYWRNHHHYY